MRGCQSSIASGGASYVVNNCCIFMTMGDYLDLRLFSLNATSTNCVLRSQQSFQYCDLRS